MLYFFGFGIVLLGYTLLDWGHYTMQGKPISMWYLLSGRKS